MAQNPYIVFVYRIVICFIEYRNLREHYGEDILRHIIFPATQRILNTQLIHLIPPSPISIFSAEEAAKTMR